MNGTFLIVAGLVWNDLIISDKLKKMTYWALLYGTFGNWLLTMLSACFGTSKMTPIAGQGYSGSPLQENFIAAGLVTVVLSMLFSLAIIVYGLRVKKTA